MPGPATKTAMARAEAMFAALGRGERAAREANAALGFDPARENLIRRWHLYATATRECRADLLWYRDLLRNAVDVYRQLHQPQPAMRRAA